MVFQTIFIHFYRAYLQWVAQDMNIHSPEGWYKVKNLDIKKRHGSSLLNRYNSSIFKMLSTIFPDQKFQPFLFDKVPQHYWENSENHKMYQEYSKYHQIDILIY